MDQIDHQEMESLLRDRFKKAWKAFQLLARRMEKEETPVPEEIHAFRLEIKKLRALLHLVASSRHQVRLPKKLRHFYRLMGRIRNIQLQLKWVDLDPGKAGIIQHDIYRKLLNTEIHGYRILAGGLLKEIRPARIEKRVFDKLPKEPAKDLAERFVRENMAKIRDLLRDFPGMEEDFALGETLHEIRKILKDLQYTWTYTGPLMEGGLVTDFAPLSRAELEQWTLLLGDLQDRQNALELMRPVYLNKIPSERERVSLLDLRSEWTEVLDRKEKELYEALSKKWLCQYQPT